MNPQLQVTRRIFKGENAIETETAYFHLMRHSLKCARSHIYLNSIGWGPDSTEIPGFILKKCLDKYLLMFLIKVPGSSQDSCVYKLCILSCQTQVSQCQPLLAFTLYQGRGWKHCQNLTPAANPLTVQQGLSALLVLDYYAMPLSIFSLDYSDLFKEKEVQNSQNILGACYAFLTNIK